MGTTTESPASDATAGVALTCDVSVPEKRTRTLSANRTRATVTALSTLFAFASTRLITMSGGTQRTGAGAFASPLHARMSGVAPASRRLWPPRRRTVVRVGGDARETRTIRANRRETSEWLGASKDDERSVGRPGRIGTGAQALDTAAVGAHHGHVRRGRRIPTRAEIDSHERDQVAGRTPCRLHVELSLASEAREPAAVGAHHADILIVVRRHAAEREPARIRRPRRARDDARRDGQCNRRKCAAVRLDDVQRVVSNERDARTRGAPCRRQVRTIREPSNGLVTGAQVEDRQPQGGV